MSAVCEPEEAILAETAGAAAPAILKGQAASPMKTLAPPTRIVLTGFMGAGKSTIGRMLGERMGWQLIDVDEAIVQKAGMPVAEIFAKYGEFVFRRMETSAIAHALGERNTIIALGGGAVEVLANRLLLEQTPRTTVVYLQAALPTLMARCQTQAGAAERPVLAAAEERFRYRTPLYRRVARLLLETGEQTPEQTVETLLRALDLPGLD